MYSVCTHFVLIFFFLQVFYMLALNRNRIHHYTSFRRVQLSFFSSEMFTIDLGFAVIFVM